MRISRRMIIKTLAAFLGTVAATGCGVATFMNSGAFGAVPEQTEAFRQCRNFRNGRFHNTLPTPMFSGDKNMLSVMFHYFTDHKEKPVPDHPLPSVRQDLLRLPEQSFVWLGHSSFLLKFGGMTILVDPVLTGYASPFWLSTRAFPGTTPYGFADLPDIDILLITHDHWDHLDRPTVKALLSRVGIAVCPLGVGAHLHQWGYATQRIRELAWNDYLNTGVMHIILTESRHFSGRGLIRNRSLWGGFRLENCGMALQFSGDGGYGPHFSGIRQRYGAADWVFPDCGQYSPDWKYLHMFPEESARAAVDLGARNVAPTHCGRFCISTHPWDEPFLRLEKASAGQSYKLSTPVIGAALSLKSPGATEAWYRHGER